MIFNFRKKWVERKKFNSACSFIIQLNHSKAFLIVLFLYRGISTHNYYINYY